MHPLHLPVFFFIDPNTHTSVPARPHLEKASRPRPYDARPKSLNGMNAFEAKIKAEEEQKRLGRPPRHPNSELQSMPRGGNLGKDGRGRKSGRNSEGSRRGSVDSANTDDADSVDLEMGRKRYSNMTKSASREALVVPVDWTNGAAIVEITSNDEIEDHSSHAPCWALTASVIIPFLLLAPGIAYASYLYVTSPRARTWHQTAYSATVGGGLLVNFFKRLFDIIEMRKRKNMDEDPERGYDPDLLRFKVLASCLCCCRRWAGVWNITFTHVLYLVFSMAQVFFLERMYDGGYYERSIYLKGVIAATSGFVLFAFFESLYYIRIETRRVGDPKMVRF